MPVGLAPAHFAPEQIPPDFTLESCPGGQTCALRGTWTAHTLAPGPLPCPLPAKPASLIVDVNSIQTLDTAGALVINLWVEQALATGLRVTVACANEKYTRLLEISTVPKGKEGDQPPKMGLCQNFLCALGHWICSLFWVFGHQLNFFGQFCATVGHLFVAPSRLRFTSFVYHIDQTGFRAIPIICLLTFLIGMVVAYMGAEELIRFGAQNFAVNLLEVTVLREMGVLITTIVVAGRSSSAFTAQIGAMVANEEVAALRSMGLNPLELLVVPRVLALIVTLPVLVFLSDIMALLGGGLALWYSIDLNLIAFIESYYQIAQLKNFFVGMIKAPFFAMVIGIIGCYHGFNASGSAESVGLLTTKSVVESIFLVILFDALFAIFFVSIGI